MKILDLHDSSGKHIANFINGQLYDIDGNNIGHYLSQYSIFIDMDGRYLGEIVDQKRLLVNTASKYKSLVFGAFGNYGNIGSYGNYGNIGACSYACYIDVVL